MRKPHNKSTPNSTSSTEDSNFLERKQNTGLRRMIVTIFKEIKEYKEHIRELRGENEKPRKDLEGKNDKC